MSVSSMAWSAVNSAKRAAILYLSAFAVAVGLMMIQHAYGIRIFGFGDVVKPALLEAPQPVPYSPPIDPNDIHDIKQEVVAARMTIKSLEQKLAELTAQVSSLSSSVSVANDQTNAVVAEATKSIQRADENAKLYATMVGAQSRFANGNAVATKPGHMFTGMANMYSAKSSWLLGAGTAAAMQYPDTKTVFDGVDYGAYGPEPATVPSKAAVKRKARGSRSSVTQ